MASGIRSWPSFTGAGMAATQSRLDGTVVVDGGELVVVDTGTVVVVVVLSGAAVVVDTGLVAVGGGC